MPRNAKERQKEWNAGRNGMPKGTERRKEWNAGRNGTPELMEHRREQNAGRKGTLEGTERRKECCTLMPSQCDTYMLYFDTIL